FDAIGQRLFERHAKFRQERGVDAELDRMSGDARHLRARFLKARRAWIEGKMILRLGERDNHRATHDDTLSRRIFGGSSPARPDAAERTKEKTVDENKRKQAAKKATKKTTKKTRGEPQTHPSRA